MNGIDSLDFVPSGLKDKVKHFLDIHIEEDKTLIHGDFGPHNTIVSDNSMVVIDWEWEDGDILFKISHGQFGLFIFIIRIFVKSYLIFSKYIPFTFNLTHIRGSGKSICDF